MAAKNDGGHRSTGLAQTVLEVFLPFLLAGLGMVLAGQLLDNVQHWPVFGSCPELFILVPALLGLKGNLEMTLASRMSTSANIGILDVPSDALSISVGNLALVQVQGIVVGSLAAILALAMSWLPQFKFDLDQALLLSTASVVTASLASFTLGLVMILVILVSRRRNVNPDNVATPIAASLGDLITLAILAQSSSIIHDMKSYYILTSIPYANVFLPACVLVLYAFVIAPLCIKAASHCVHTKKVLHDGWVPVLSAMVISSLSGSILNQTIHRFPKVAAFQPVINGVAGNLVAVQASRLSTSLHRSKDTKDDANIANLLMAMVIPGHVIFNSAIAMLSPAGQETLDSGGLPQDGSIVPFTLLYLTAAVIQVNLLLRLAGWLVLQLWSSGIDPDNAAIPFLTSLGDLLGGILLASAVYTENWLISS